MKAPAPYAAAAPWLRSWHPLPRLLAEQESARRNSQDASWSTAPDRHEAPSHTPWCRRGRGRAGSDSKVRFPYSRDR
eukprot:scaffold83938_cov61-Phaeocystis_antarctica.AAC.3